MTTVSPTLAASIVALVTERDRRAVRAYVSALLAEMWGAA